MPNIRFAKWSVPAVMLGMMLVAATPLLRPNVALAQGTDAQREACSGDAMRLCPEFIPDVNKVTACMKQKRSQLSPACRQVMAGGSSSHHHRYHCRYHCG
jgi:hypothetical protein